MRSSESCRRWQSRGATGCCELNEAALIVAPRIADPHTTAALAPVEADSQSAMAANRLAARSKGGALSFSGEPAWPGIDFERFTAGSFGISDRYIQTAACIVAQEGEKCQAFVPSRSIAAHLLDKPAIADNLKLALVSQGSRAAPDVGILAMSAFFPGSRRCSLRARRAM